MTVDPPSVSDWAAERGRKWTAHIAATEAMLAPVDAPLLRALELDGAGSVADIGCGGGRTTRSIAGRLDASATVHGVDISPDIVAVAKTGAIPPQVSFHCLDAGTQAPPVPQYDRLCSRFGVMFFDNPIVAFSRLANWLHPDGRFAFAVWGPMVCNPWMTTLRDAVAGEVPLPERAADAPGPFRYADDRRFIELLQSCGFAEVRVEYWRGQIPLGGGVNAERAAHFALSAFSVGELVAGDDRMLARVRRRLSSTLADYESDGIVRTDASVYIASGGRDATAALDR